MSGFEPSQEGMASQEPPRPPPRWNIADSQANLEALIAQVSSRLGVVPFVGAGLSVPLGFMSWRDFLIDLGRATPIEARLEELLDNGLYEAAAEEVLQARGANQLQVKLRATYGRAIADSELVGPVTVLPSIFDGPVITTNYDQVLEAAYRSQGLPFETVLFAGRVDAVRDAYMRHERVLIKIHGDTSDRSDRVLTTTDYERHYGSDNPLRGVLAFLLTRPLLFLGCSLETDRTVEVIGEWSSSHTLSSYHFAILPRPQTDDTLFARNRFLSDMSILPIWYPRGEHSAVTAILQHLVNASAERGFRQHLLAGAQAASTGIAAATTTHGPIVVSGTGDDFSQRKGSEGRGPSTSVVTLLFVDLVESTALAERLGEERADELRSWSLSTMSEVVTMAGGVVVKGLGDGIMATFRSALNAVTAAGQIRQRMSERRKQVPELPLIRAGVSAGEAAWENGDWFGRPVIEAARLCAVAAPDEVLVADVARRLIGGRGNHQFGAGRALHLKGLTEPFLAVPLDDSVRPTRPTAEAEHRPAIEQASEPHIVLPGAVAGPPQGPFVGREEPLARLRRISLRAEPTGDPRLVLLAGDPGIGKTRLVTELAHELHAQGVLVLYGRCIEENAVPFQPFVEALRHYIAMSPPDRLRASLLDRRGAELTRILPELSSRLPGLGEPTRAEPETERYLLFEAVAQVLAGVASSRPLLVVLEDLHWADRSTLWLLGHVVRHPEPTGLSIIGTYRETELDPDSPLAAALPGLLRETVVQRLRLAGLRETEVGMMVEELLGERPPAEFAHSVHTETNGNPLFVREVLAHLREVGALRSGDGRWVIPIDVASGGLPEGVTDVIGRRLNRLTDNTRHALEVGSIIGREFDIDVLARALDDSSEALLDAMDEAVSARLVGEVPGVIGRYSFSHALVRAALTETLTANRRAHLHRRIGEALEAGAIDPSGADAAELTHHYLAASGVDPSKVVAYARAAGDYALTALAYDEAATAYEQALNTHSRTRPMDDHQRLDLLIALGGAQRRSGAMTVARDTFETAAAAARKIADSDALGQAALGFAEWGEAPGFDAAAAALTSEALDALPPPDSPLRCRLLALLSWLAIFADRHQAATAGQEAVAMARRLGDPALLGAALEVWHRNQIFANADLEARLALSEEMIALAEQSGDPDRQFWAHVQRVIDLLEAGDFATLDETLDNYAGLCTRFQLPGFKWFLIGWQAMRALFDGRLGDAEPLIKEALKVGEPTRGWVAGAQFGLQLLMLRREQDRQAEVEQVLAAVVEVPNTPMFRSALLRLNAECGSRETATRELDELAADNFAAIPTGNWATQLMLAWLTDACVALADATRAAVLYQRLKPYAGRCVWSGWGGTFEGAVDHYLGLAATTTGDWDAAEGHFVSAQNVHARAGARTWTAHTNYDHARMLLARGQSGDQERAQALLQQAKATAMDLGMAALLVHISALE